MAVGDRKHPLAKMVVSARIRTEESDEVAVPQHVEILAADRAWPRLFAEWLPCPPSVQELDRESLIYPD